jgi:ketosteroid isomerase-like protein
VFAPDAEFVDIANAPDQHQTIKGRDAIRETWSRWMEPFDELSAHVEEFTGAGDFVLCATHWVAHGKESGLSVDLRQFDLYEFRQGKIVSATLGLKSKEEATEAAGVRFLD